MTEQNFGTPPRKRPTRAEVFEILGGVISIGLIIAGIYSVIDDRVELAIFFVLIAIWVEIGG